MPIYIVREGWNAIDWAEELLSKKRGDVVEWMGDWIPLRLL